MPILLALAAAAFFSSVATRMTEPLVGLLARDFSVQPADIALFATAFALPYALFQLVFGPLGDRFGKLRVVRLATLALAATLAAAALAPGYDGMVAIRFASGLFAGAIIPLALASIGDLYALPGRQIVLSRFMLATITGQIVGAFLTGFLAEFMPWRAVFGLFAALAAAVGLGLFLLPDGNGAPPGSLTVGGALRRYGSILVRPPARRLLPTVFVEGAIYFAFISFAGPYLSERRGYSSGEIGAVVAGYGVGGILAAVVLPWILGRFGPIGMFVGGGFLGAAATAAFALDLPIAVYGAAAAAIGASFTLIHNNLQTRATELAPEARGSAFAVFACSLFLGNSAGPFLMGLGTKAFGYETVFVILGVVLAAFGPVAARVLRAGR